MSAAPSRTYVVAGQTWPAGTVVEARLKDGTDEVVRGILGEPFSDWDESALIRDGNNQIHHLYIDDYTIRRVDLKS